jgi:hypothetical protein
LILGCASWQPYVVALIGLLAPSTEPISFSIEPVISLVYKVNIPHEADPPGCTNFFKISIDEFERADDPCNSIYTGRDGTSEGDDAWASKTDVPGSRGKVQERHVLRSWECESSFEFFILEVNQAD